MYVGRRGVEVIDVGRGSIWVDLGRSRGVRGGGVSIMHDVAGFFELDWR